MKVVFQGIDGAYSQLAIKEVFGPVESLGAVSFEEMFEAVASGKADYAMVPVENSAAGRVTEIHSLLAESNLHIVKEHYQSVHHCLLGTGRRADLKRVSSQVQALSQCRRFILAEGLDSVAATDTATAAKQVAATADETLGAIASELAAELYGLKILAADIQDQSRNITRFLTLAVKSDPPKNLEGAVTTLFFHTKNEPSALYNALGGFASQGLNMTRLEGLVLNASFSQAHFYVDVEGHANSMSMRAALKQLKKYTHSVKVLGVYAAHPRRRSTEVADD